jgi:hypothetical protein
VLVSDLFFPAPSVASRRAGPLDFSGQRFHLSPESIIAEGFVLARGAA